MFKLMKKTAQFAVEFFGVGCELNVFIYLKKSIYAVVSVYPVVTA